MKCGKGGESVWTMNYRVDMLRLYLSVDRIFHFLSGKMQAEILLYTSQNYGSTKYVLE